MLNQLLLSAHVGSVSETGRATSFDRCALCHRVVSLLHRRIDPDVPKFRSTRADSLHVPCLSAVFAVVTIALRLHFIHSEHQAKILCSVGLSFPPSTRSPTDPCTMISHTHTQEHSDWCIRQKSTWRKRMRFACSPLDRSCLPKIQRFSGGCYRGRSAYSRILVSFVLIHRYWKRERAAEIEFLIGMGLRWDPLE